jgi:hypothetical protein
MGGAGIRSVLAPIRAAPWCMLSDHFLPILSRVFGSLTESNEQWADDFTNTSPVCFDFGVQSAECCDYQIGIGTVNGCQVAGFGEKAPWASWMLLQCRNVTDVCFYVDDGPLIMLPQSEG